MNSDKEKLLKLLSDGKITEEDFKNLSAALDKKNSSPLSLLVNPFQRIAGPAALCLGVLVLFCMSLIGSLAYISYGGILDLHFSKQVTFVKLLYQTSVSWLILSVLFFITAHLNRQKGLRIIDFLGTTALSRFPYLFLSLFTWVWVTLNPSILEFRPGTTVPTSILMMVIPLLVGFIWQITAYFYALRVSSGLIGAKLWISFISTILIGEVLSVILTRIS